MEASAEAQEYWRGVRDRIREALHVRAWSQRRLEREAELTAGYLTPVLNGEKEPGIERLRRMARALDVHYTWLVAGEGESGLVPLKESHPIAHGVIQLLKTAGEISAETAGVISRMAAANPYDLGRQTWERLALETEARAAASPKDTAKESPPVRVLRSSFEPSSSAATEVRPRVGQTDPRPHTKASEDLGGAVYVTWNRPGKLAEQPGQRSLAEGESAADQLWVAPRAAIENADLELQPDEPETNRLVSVDPTFKSEPAAPAAASKQGPAKKR